MLLWRAAICERSDRSPLLPSCPPICSLNFKDIVSLVNCAYCLGQLLQFVAFIWLRIK